MLESWGKIAASSNFHASSIIDETDNMVIDRGLTNLSIFHVMNLSNIRCYRIYKFIGIEKKFFKLPKTPETCINQRLYRQNLRYNTYYKFSIYPWKTGTLLLLTYFSSRDQRFYRACYAILSENNSNVGRAKNHTTFFFPFFCILNTNTVQTANQLTETRIYM